MKRIQLFLAPFLFLPFYHASAESLNAGRASIYLGVQDFYWDEQDPEGIQGEPGQLLEENGYLFELGVAYDNNNMANTGLIYSVSTGITAGTVDYDGQTQDGDPASTDVDYLSWDTEGSLGYRFQPGKVMFLDVIAGIGYDYWRRELQPTTISSGNNAGDPVSGATEHYNLIYARLTGGLFIPGQSWDNRLRFGVRGPLFMEQTVEQLPGITLEPKMQTSPFVAWQLDYKGASDKARLGLAIYYEETRFEQSEYVPYGTVYKYQPESNSREAGIRGFLFF